MKAALLEARGVGKRFGAVVAAAGIDFRLDARARRDWGWQPEFDQARAFSEYLVPNIRARYGG